MALETDVKPTVAHSQKGVRRGLFGVLNRIIVFSDGKRVLSGNSDHSKQAWSRIAISAIGVYGNLLKDVELEEIEERLVKLEAEKAGETTK